MKKIFSLLFVLFAGMTAFAQDATVSVDGVRIKAGGTAVVTVNVANVSSYCGAGMYVNLPEGFTFVYDEEEELYCVGGDVLAKSHSVADRLQNNNKLRFVITSPKNATFKYDNGSLVTFTIKCKSNKSDGVYEGKLSTIEFSKPQSAVLSVVDDVAFKIIVGDSGNSICADDATSRVGKRITLPINLVNFDQITAVEFKLTLPDGINLEDATVTDRGIDHKVSYIFRGGSYKFEVYSAKGRPFYGNEGAFLELVLKSDNTIEAGDYVVRISDIIMYSSGGTEFTAKDFTAKLHLGVAITVEDITKLIYEYLEP